MTHARLRFLLVLLLVGLPLPVLAPSADARADAPGLEGLAPIGELVRRGQDEAALAALARLPASQRDQGPARYLEGRLAERLARLEVAEAAFALAITRDLPEVVLRDAEARRARLLARTGRCEEAIPRLLAEGSGRSRALAGECALALGELDRAIALLEAVDRESPGPVDSLSLRMTLAEALRRKGETTRAVALLRSTWLERPAHPRRALLEEALRELDASALTRTEEESRAELARLLAGGSYAEARRALSTAPEPSTVEARLAQMRKLAELAMRTRAYAEAARAYEALHARSNEPADAFEHARALVRAGEHTQALPLLDALAARHPTTTSGQSALYLAADIALGLGLPDRALAYVRTRRGERASLLGLGIVLHALMQGDAALAERHVDAVARVPDPFARERAAYLRARITEMKGEDERAKRAYRALVEQGPFAYYGLAAAMRLRALGEVSSAPMLSLAPPPASEPELPVEVELFHVLGLVDDAHAALERLERTLSLDLVGRVRLFARVGHHARAYALARGQLDASRLRSGSRLSRALVEAAYPQPFAHEVLGAARQLDVPPAYIFGTMRQESAYDPNARSRAGALGLLQLMPQTAARVARALDLDVDERSLFDPRTNVRLGVGEMAQLMRRFDGQLPLVIAAYNAGPQRVALWLPSGRSMPTDLFVERIAFDETRRYVRRVLGHFAVYSALLGGPDAIHDALPEIVSRP